MATHVFYSPHSDDEAIGMAGSIIRAKADGHRVVLVLVTDNKASARAVGRFPLGASDLAAARLIEWRRSAAVLEADETRYLGIAERVIVDDLDFARASLLGAMSAIDHEFGGPGTVFHHTVMGSGDIHRELGRSTSAHRLCEDAAVLFAQRYPTAEVFLHAVYVYSFPPAERWRIAMGAYQQAGKIQLLELTPAEFEKKRRALDAYKVGGDCIGYGYESVPDLIDAASSDPREYLWKL